MVRPLLFLVQHPANPHTPTDDAIHEQERIFDDHQFPRAGHLAAPTNPWEGLKLEGVAANLAHDPVGGRLAVLGVEGFNHQQVAAGPRRPLKPLA